MHFLRMPLQGLEGANGSEAAGAEEVLGVARVDELVVAFEVGVGAEGLAAVDAGQRLGVVSGFGLHIIPGIQTE